MHDSIQCESLIAHMHHLPMLNVKTCIQTHTAAGGTCCSVLFGIPHTDAAQHFSKKQNQKRRHHLSVLLIRMKSPKHKYRKNTEYIIFFL